jgi:hypothetical protein
VEIGQLLFIGAILLLLAGARRLAAAFDLAVPRWWWRIPPYVIGGLANFWVFERVAAF